MFKLNFFTFLILTSILSQLTFGANLITKNLYIGVKDPEVTILQKFLNSSPETQVSVSGEGSPGLETDYFGPKTLDAVVRFQNKNATEILAPLNLSTGTGYVGPLSIEKINSSSITVPTAPAITSPTSVVTTPSESTVDKIKSIIASFTKTSASSTTMPKITKINPEVVDDGETITIYGTGFTSKNTVVVSIENPTKYTNLKTNKDGTSISFTLDTALGANVRAGLQKAFLQMPSNLRSEAMTQFLQKYRKGHGQKETGDRSILLPIFIRVENENGKSASFSTTINIFEEIY